MHSSSPLPGHRIVAWNTVALLQWALIVGLGTSLALWWQPEPHSDWQYYWHAAGNPDAYERGGLALWLLAIPKALGLSPAASALFINLPAASLLCLLASRADVSRWRLPTQMMVAYLLLITPFFGIVQLDLIAATQLGLGLWLVLDPRIRMHIAPRLFLSVLAVAIAVSTKPQYALVLWMLLVMMSLLWIGTRGGAEGLPRALCGVLLAGSLLGFAADMAMRQSSGRMEAVRTSSAVTLYGGMLASSNSRDRRCGYWTEEAASAAREDLGKAMPVAVRDRLLARPPGYWISVVGCKLPQIVSPPPYALYWLVRSPNIREGIDASPDRERIEAIYQRLITCERRVYRALTALILLMCFWTTMRLRRCGESAGWLPAIWVLAFWCVHAVFEIQGRYFLGMFVLAPLLCAFLFDRYRNPQESRPPQRPAAPA